jgi:acetyl esterase/lipase
LTCLSDCSDQRLHSIRHDESAAPTDCPWALFFFAQSVEYEIGSIAGVSGIVEPWPKDRAHVSNAGVRSTPIVLQVVAVVGVLGHAGLVHAQPQPTVYDVPYGDDHWRQKLDLYLPGNSCPANPLVIYIHGGGWLVGDKSDVAPHVESLLDDGFAVAAVNYRYSYQAIWPAQIFDCKGAVRWLRANATTYRIDPSRIAVFGDSAGGHLAAMLGSSGEVAQLEGVVGGNRGVSSRVQYVGDLSGPTDLIAMASVDNSPGSTVSQLIGHPIQDLIDHIDDPDYAELLDLINSANPIQWVTSDDPPCAIVHGDADDMVPVSESQILHDALTGVGVFSTLRIVPGGGHELPEAEYAMIFDRFAESLDPVPPTEGDSNCNGVVDIDDLLNVIGHWGPCSGTCPEQPCLGDVSPERDHIGNCLVDIDDLITVVTHWS